ncbi:MAG: hypothetical protein JOY53_13550 [Acidobacteriaceae bacterium]|nr:hypothetical protein [Acidobacteriaceae bacterium]
MAASLPSSTLLAMFLCILTSTGVALSSERFQHWFLIPITLCGIIASTDAIEWLRGKLDLYDPVGLVGAFAVHFFFLAPLLTIYWDEFLPVAPPPDWRDWLGAMGILNLVGLVAYRICRDVFNRRTVRPAKTYWRLDLTKLRFVAPVALLVTGAAQAAVYAKFGGITGYMVTRASYVGGKLAFTGLGWVFMISESFPIIVTLVGIAYARKRHVSWTRIAVGLFLMFVLLMLFGGLRGSRSNTVDALFWIVGAIHFLIRPVPRKVIGVGVLFLLLFLYAYGFYKSGGLKAFEGAEARAEIAQKHGRTFHTVVLGDLGRADLQAYILYRLVNDSAHFKYALGRSYVTALTIFIPHWILPERPETIDQEGTEIQAGSGSYVPDVFKSSKVYGLAGEAMMNFGIVSVPIAYAVFGLLVGWFRRAVRRLAPGDIRLFFVPLCVYLCTATLGSDSPILAYGIAKFLTIPVVVVYLSSIRLRRSASSTVPVAQSVAQLA